MAVSLDLRRTAREIFAAALSSMDARRALHSVVGLDGAGLRVADLNFDNDAHPLVIYSIALGKAAEAMALALEETLGDTLAGGVISAPPVSAPFPDRWRVFAGGHPLPNEASLAAAEAAFDLLERANNPNSLVIFLVSGGGSAMVEWPRDTQISLADLREANRVLVSCGATINEINAVRRAISPVKGGGLAARAPRASQITLIISDTNPHEEANVASSPTFPPPPGAPDAAQIVARYDLAARLPASLLRVIGQRSARTEEVLTSDHPLRRRYVLLDNEQAIARAAAAAKTRGFEVETARDLVEQPIAEGCAALVSRLFDLLRRRQDAGRSEPLCLLSGGEFACPVKGNGIGGRNLETALRCALEIEAMEARKARRRTANESSPRIVAFSAGTDGIDGNSPAAGAIADDTTLTRARALCLDAQRFLDQSDAYTFFERLGDTIVTGPTGTNVRDLRIMLAR